MIKRWGGVCVLVLALGAYGCDTANGGQIGDAGAGGSGAGGSGAGGSGAGGSGAGGSGAGGSGAGGSGAGGSGAGGSGAGGSGAGGSGAGGSGAGGSGAGGSGTGGGSGSCAPALGKMVPLLTSGGPTPIYTDMDNGFAISAVNCATPMLCDVTFSFRGIGANAYGDALAFDSSDSLLIAFFDRDGNARNANNVSIVLHMQGMGGTVDVRYDGDTAVSFPTTPGQAIDLSGTLAHEIEVTSTGGFIFWQALNYDHECL